MNKIKKGDDVIIIAGKDRGKRGPVLAVLDRGEKILVENINMAKKHVKPNPNAGVQGGIISKPVPLHRSKVMVYDPTAKKGSRVGCRIVEGKRVRYFKSSNQLIDIKG